MGDTCGGGNMECPSDTKVMRAGVTDTDCFTTKCDNTNDDDVDTCCIDRAACSSLHATGSGCGEGWKNINAAGLCVGEACDLETDKATCCEELDKCSTVTCTTANHVIMAAAPTYCAGAACDESECCVEKEKCAV